MAILSKDIYDKEYTELVYSKLPPELTHRQVSFIVKKLRLQKGMKILDVGCGNGRHLLEFARRGYHVTGTDYSKYLLGLAKKEARREKLSVKLIQKDMRKISFWQEFDAVISIFSFGLLGDKNDHDIVLKRIGRSLKKNGRLMLITGNAAQILKKTNWSDKKDKETGFTVGETSKSKLLSGIIVEKKELLDQALLRHVVTWKWKEKNKIFHLASALYIFTLLELKKKMNKAGLKIVKVWGDFDGTPFSGNSKKMIVSALKK